MLEIYDNIMSLADNDKLYHEILYNRNFKYGEMDKLTDPPRGLVMGLEGPLLDIFHSFVVAQNNSFNFRKIQRAYVNLFLPNENPFFHEDGDVFTNLFYLNPQYDIDEGGETQFFIDDKIIGIQSKPSRLVVFDGRILHRATSFRTKPRITVALKYFKG